MARTSEIFGGHLLRAPADFLNFVLKKYVVTGRSPFIVKNELLVVTVNIFLGYINKNDEV